MDDKTKQALKTCILLSTTLLMMGDISTEEKLDEAMENIVGLLDKSFEIKRKEDS